MSAAWAAARAANATDDDEDGEKDRFGARGAKKREVGKIESDSEKEEKAKFASRKSGTRIAEVEKRPVVARLKADEAEWKKRDVHTRHETATLEIGKAVAWHYAPVGKPGELWFRFGVIVDIIGGKLKEDKAGKNSNPDVNVTLRAFDPPLRYPLNESDLLCLRINQHHGAHCLICAEVTSRTSSESLVRRTTPKKLSRISGAKRRPNTNASSRRRRRKGRLIRRRLRPS